VRKSRLSIFVSLLIMKVDSYSSAFCSQLSWLLKWQELESLVGFLTDMMMQRKLLDSD
jgi:hypothetical protein